MHSRRTYAKHYNFSTNQHFLRTTGTRACSNVIKELYNFNERSRDLQKNSKSNFDCLGQLAGYIPLLTFCEFLHLKMGCAFSGDNHRVPKVFRRKKVGIFFSAGKHLLTLQELLTIDRQIYGSTETLFISQ